MTRCYIPSWVKLSPNHINFDCEEIANEKGNGSTGIPIGVLEELVARIGAITPDKYIAPEPDAKPDKDALVAATATDGIKQLFTLQCILVDQIKEFGSSASESAQACLKEALQKGPFKTMEEIETPGTTLFEEHAKMAACKVEIGDLRELLGLVKGMLFLDIRRQHPDLANAQSVGINNDWTLRWKEHGDDDDDSGMSIIRILAICGGLPGGLAELFAEHGRPN